MNPGAHEGLADLFAQVLHQRLNSDQKITILGTNIRKTMSCEMETLCSGAGLLLLTKGKLLIGKVQSSNLNNCSRTRVNKGRENHLFSVTGSFLCETAVHNDVFYWVPCPKKCRNYEYVTVNSTYSGQRYQLGCFQCFLYVSYKIYLLKIISIDVLF